MFRVEGLEERSLLSGIPGHVVPPLNLILVSIDAPQQVNQQASGFDVTIERHDPAGPHAVVDSR